MLTPVLDSLRQPEARCVIPVMAAAVLLGLALCIGLLYLTTLFPLPAAIVVVAAWLTAGLLIAAEWRYGRLLAGRTSIFRQRYTHEIAEEIRWAGQRYWFWFAANVTLWVALGLIFGVIMLWIDSRPFVVALTAALLAMAMAALIGLLSGAPIPYLGICWLHNDINDNNLWAFMTGTLLLQARFTNARTRGLLPGSTTFRRMHLILAAERHGQNPPVNPVDLANRPPWRRSLQDESIRRLKASWPIALLAFLLAFPLYSLMRPHLQTNLAQFVQRQTAGTVDGSGPIQAAGATADGEAVAANPTDGNGAGAAGGSSAPGETGQVDDASAAEDGGREGGATEPGAKGQSGGGTPEPGGTGQPGDTGQSGGTSEPGGTGQPGDTGQSGGTPEPGGTGQPGDTGQSGGTLEPGGTSQPGDTGQSGGTPEPGGTGQPGDTGQSGGTLEPGGTGQPGDTGQSGGTPEPGGTGQPGDTGQSGGTPEPGGTGQPGDTGQSGGTPEPGGTGQPSSTIAPGSSEEAQPADVDGSGSGPGAGGTFAAATTVLGTATRTPPPSTTVKPVPDSPDQRTTVSLPPLSPATGGADLTEGWRPTDETAGPTGAQAIDVQQQPVRQSNPRPRQRIPNWIRALIGLR